MIQKPMSRLCSSGLLLAALTVGAASAGAATLDEAEKGYFGCLHLQVVAGLAKAPAPPTAAGVGRAVDSAMARCERRFAAYTDALVEETLRRNTWTKPNTRGVSQFRDEAPARIRQRLVDAYARGL